MKTILVDCINGLAVKTDQGPVEVYKEMFELLESFPNSKLILTGANDEEYRMFELQQMPYELFTLKHNPEKTNPSYYLTLFERHNLKPDEVVYFEHKLEAVESARSVGIETYHWDHIERPLDALEKFLRNELEA